MYLTIFLTMILYPAAYILLRKAGVFKKHIDAILYCRKHGGDPSERVEEETSVLVCFVILLLAVLFMPLLLIETGRRDNVA